MNGQKTELNQAIQIYLGFEISPTPKSDERKIIDIFGEARGSRFIETIKHLLHEINTYPIDWTCSDLNQAGEAVRTLLMSRHPDLSKQSISALVWQFTYNWR